MPNTLFPTADDATRDRLSSISTLTLLNGFDWASTSLGPIASWPEALRSTVRMMMLSQAPMVMLAGERDGTLIYNDGYAVFAGERHPAVFGMPALAAWPEIADFNAENMRRGFAGEAWHLSNQELVLDRGDGPRPAFIDLNYSPVPGEDGVPVAVLVIVQETTERVQVERALTSSEERRELALSGGAIVGTWDWDIVADKVFADDRFARLYSIDPAAAASGVGVDHFIAGVHPADRERVAGEIQQAIDRKSDFRSEYRLETSDSSVRWVVASGRPRYDAAGRAVRFPGVAIDITQQKLDAVALSESEQRFRVLADTMPQMVWSTLPDGFHDYYNARWYEFTGVPEGSTDGAGWNGMFHPDDQERAWATWRHSLETGEPYRIEYRLRHHSGEYRWVLGSALAMHDEAGRIVRWFGTCTDIHETRAMAEEREVIAQELSHRIKNIFSVITGIIALSARTRLDYREYSDQLRDRIMALGRAHDFVRPHSRASARVADPHSFAELFAELMQPYRAPDRHAVVFEGADTAIDDRAATPLALIFHELATNSAKYGALSAGSGTVLVTAALDGDLYRLTWKEIGGPAVSAPGDREGFGSRLLKLSAESQLRGTITRHWDTDGLRVDIDLPVDSLTGRI